MAGYVDLDSVWRDRVAYPNPLDYALLPNQVDTWIKSSRDTRALPANPNERPLDFVNSITLLAATLPYPRIEIFTNSFVNVTSISAGNVFNMTGPFVFTNGDIVMTSSPGFVPNGIFRDTEYHILGPFNAPVTSFQVSLTPGGVPVTLTPGTGLNLQFALIPVANYSVVMEELTAAKQLVQLPRLYVDFHSQRYKDTRLINTAGGVLSDAKFIIGIDKVQFDDNLTPIWIHYKSHGEQVFRYKRDDPVYIRFMTRDGTTIPFFDESDLSIPTNPNKQSLVTFMIIPFIKDNRFSNGQLEPIQ